MLKHKKTEAKTSFSTVPHSGMPVLELRKRPLAFYEFWPTPLIYTPIFLLWLLNMLRYRSVRFPLFANPGFHLGGLVGESKADNFRCAGLYADQYIAPWCLFVNGHGGGSEENLNNALNTLEASELSFPVVAKPDIGCRGKGVRVIRSQKQLADYLNNFPEKAGLILQNFIPWEPEAGIFYIRKPGQQQGQIFSLALKYQPYVYGNGVDTLETLIRKDDRAGQIADLYLPRHKENLQIILPPGQPYRLSFTGSHSGGAIFRDGHALITKELLQVFDSIAKDINGFYFGRFDVRFADEQSLREGKNIKIMEINGISSEAAHVWDSGGTLRGLYRTLFKQYQILFEIGATNYRKDRAQRKCKKPWGGSNSLKELVKSWRKELSLIKRYPSSE